QRLNFAKAHGELGLMRCDLAHQVFAQLLDAHPRVGLLLHNPFPEIGQILNVLLGDIVQEVFFAFDMVVERSAPQLDSIAKLCHAHSVITAFGKQLCSDAQDAGTLVMFNRSFDGVHRFSGSIRHLADAILIFAWPNCTAQSSALPADLSAGQKPIRPITGPGNNIHAESRPKRSNRPVTRAIETTVIANPMEFWIASALPTS